MQYILRTIVAFVVLAPVLTFVTLFSSAYDGVTTFVSVIVIAPIGTVLSIAAVSVLGLPLRFVRVLRDWWLRVWPLFWVVGVVGLVLIIASLLASSPETSTVEGVTYRYQVPQQALLVVGWLCLAFAAMHARLPVRKRAAKSTEAFERPDSA